jgi:hypothetical protein
MDNNTNCCETPEMTINRLKDTNYKLHEEINLLQEKNNKLKKILASLNCMLDSFIENIKNEEI